MQFSWVEIFVCDPVSVHVSWFVFSSGKCLFALGVCQSFSSHQRVKLL